MELSPVETEAYPVTVAWELNPENGIEYSIITEGLGKQPANTRLPRSGSTLMTSSSGGRLRLNAEATGRRSNHELPTEYILAQNYPNPFNPETKIHYELPYENHVRLIVYDVLGKEVAVLVDEVRDAGRYHATLNAVGLASGVYFYRLQAGSFNAVKKLIVLR